MLQLIVANIPMPKPPPKPPALAPLTGDRLVRQIAREQARLILALRLGQGFSRLAVVKRTGINWKRIRGFEQGDHVASLDELVKLAIVFSVRPLTLMRKMIASGGKCPKGQGTALRGQSAPCDSTD